MFGRETRMLLRHYLEQGSSKSELSRQLGVSRDTLHRWIRDGDLERDLDAEAVHYRPRPTVATKLEAYKPIIEARLTAYPELSSVTPRRDPCRRVRGRLLAAESIRSPGATDATIRAGHPIRDAGRPTGASGLRALSDAMGRAVRPARRSGLLAAVVVPVLPTPGHGDAHGRP
jgi:transposase